MMKRKNEDFPVSPWLRLVLPMQGLISGLGTKSHMPCSQEKETEWRDFAILLNLR